MTSRLLISTTADAWVFDLNDARRTTPLVESILTVRIGGDLEATVLLFADGLAQIDLDLQGEGFAATFDGPARAFALSWKLLESRGETTPPLVLWDECVDIESDAPDEPTTVLFGSEPEGRRTSS
jgi:hypothetical protein